MRGVKRYKGFMMRGVSKTSIDRWGRIRVPPEFLIVFKERYGNRIFITSLDPKNILIYPLSEWGKIVEKARGKADSPLVREPMGRINFLGFRAEIDERDRILIPKELRNKTDLKGEIIIEGKEDYLALSKKK